MTWLLRVTHNKSWISLSESSEGCLCIDKECLSSVDDSMPLSSESESTSDHFPPTSASRVTCDAYRYTNNIISNLGLSLFQDFLVVSLLSTSFRRLYVIVFPLKSASLCFIAHFFLDEVAGTILFINATRVPFRWSFNNSPNLRKRRNFAFTVVLLVMSMGIKNVSHLNQLKIAFKRGGKLSLWQIEPLSASVSLIVL